MNELRFFNTILPCHYLVVVVGVCTVLGAVGCVRVDCPGASSCGEAMEIEPYVPDPEKPPAIICDIDGTLAHHTGIRGHHDYGKVLEDTVDPIIRNLVDREWASGYDILIVTGRPQSCHKDTYYWLLENHIPVDALFMRHAAHVDERKQKLADWIVKLDLFNRYIRDEYNVEYVLDDRDQCVDLWRKLGLKCLQVANGDF
jgi:hypothetical protein